MNDLRDDNYEDSKENWVDIVLFLADEERPEVAFETYRCIILHTVPRVKELKAKQKISDWHFRFGSFGADVAFRLRSGIEYKNEVVQAVEQLATELTQKRLVKESTFGKDPAWIKDDKEFKQEYKNHWCTWWWKIECDEILSELACKVLSYQDPQWAFNYAFHDLFNMFRRQSLNGLFAFRAGTSVCLSDLLSRESAYEFRRVIEYRKNRFVEKKIQVEKETFLKTSGQKTIPKETLEGWTGKYEKMWNETWKKRALVAMFLY